MLLCLYSVFPRPSSLRLRFASQLQWASFQPEERPHLLPVGPLVRSMHGRLLLIWVQGLTLAAFLTSAEVTQVNWEQRDQILAVYSAEQGWYVPLVFSERVVPGPSLGLTFKLLTMNDTGEYFCTFHTYPDGIYKERIFLKVQESSGPQFQMTSLGGAMAAVLGIICLLITGAAVRARRKSPRIHSMGSGQERTAAEPQEAILRCPSAPEGPVQTEAAPADLCGEEDDYAEPRDYFNVLSYRSLESFSVLAKTV
ncbi:T-cell immunoreceptor with Ig and ITIM domains isoform X3 [Alexandromys fortis]|uniref:T-cell immunoreceptor with Ig and ITIM domains isoform X3 n=1 Tax=Alexandromys fortis TaxID=100897 RepID=UPI002153A3D2|nr:T-cell immunoreceptor with Ig and ITIM domains isoform X3 [Microtus fortis]